MLQKKMVNEPKNLSETYLLEHLYQHKNILSKYMYNYLECLIRLDISILKSGYITEEEMQYLMQLGLVQSVAKYNLYERTYAIFQKDSQDYDIIIDPHNEQKEYLKVMGVDGKEKYVIFDYQAINNIININLYNLVESSSERQKEIGRIDKHIDALYANQSKFSQTEGVSFQDRIRNAQQTRHELMERTSLPGRKVETLNHFNDLLLTDFGYSTKELPNATSSTQNMEKTLTKKYPGIDLTQNIKYY